MATILRHELESGEIETRQSNRAYTHIIAGYGENYWTRKAGTGARWHALRWSASAANAAKSLGSSDFAGYSRLRIEQINGGQR